MLETVRRDHCEEDFTPKELIVTSGQQRRVDLQAMCQERGAIAVVASATFKCKHCGKTVHHWSGMYTYSDWKSVGSHDEDES